MKNTPIHERYGMTLRDARRHLALTAKQFGRQMQQVDTSGLRSLNPFAQILHDLPARVFRSRDYLVQVYVSDGDIRISACRTELDSEGYWKDGISWEELQRIKNECGFADKCAVEIYPPEADVVNVANMRHLWIYEPPFMWRSKHDGTERTDWETRP